MRDARESQSGRNINRRSFLGKSVKGMAVAQAGLAAGSGTSAVSAKNANEKVVIGHIGAGGRGCLVAQGIFGCENVEFKYLCEVNELRGHSLVSEIEAKQGYAPKRVIEMREMFDDPDVDGIVVATPEHWHALASIWAMQAGKDVYVEKCPTVTIDEGRKMVQAAQKYNRILQVGTQNRSGTYAHSARKYILDGGLGKVVDVKCYTTLNGGSWTPRPDDAVPKGLDWDRWLGPARYVPYNPGRHSMTEKGRGWQKHWDYCGGQLADDGSHVLDLARLAIGDPKHPKSVVAAGGRIAFRDSREVPDVQVVIYDFGDFVMTMDCTECIPYNVKSSDEVRYGSKFPYWPQNATRIEIYGTERMMYLGRHGGGWQVFEKDGEVVDFEYGYKPDNLHFQNFVDCIRSRQQPNGEVEQGHLSASLVHLGNISLRLGNKQLVFDGAGERFVGNEEANEFLRRPGRKHYRIPDRV